MSNKYHFQLHINYAQSVIGFGNHKVDVLETINQETKKPHDEPKKVKREMPGLGFKVGKDFEYQIPKQGDKGYPLMKLTIMSGRMLRVSDISRVVSNGQRDAAGYLQAKKDSELREKKEEQRIAKEKQKSKENTNV